MGRMELLAASAKHAAAPDHRVGPPALRRRRRPRGTASRRPGEYAGAGQARPGGERPVAGADAGHSAAVGTRADFAARGIAAPAANSPHQFGDGRRAVLSQRCWHWKMCIGLIRQRSISCAASPNAARWRPCSFSSPPGQSSGLPGACARITARSPWLRLIARRCGTVIGGLAARDALPKEVVDGLTERTGGVPLFVEEVTRLLLERGQEGGMEAIPPTLQQSLMARLDRLGSAREVVQIGRGSSAAASPTRLFAPLPTWRTPPCRRRWNGSLRATSCWCRAYHRNPNIVSSMF